MKLIYLTKINFINLFEVSEVKFIKLNPDKIISMKQENNVTRINLKGNISLYVKETSEQIKKLIKGTINE